MNILDLIIKETGNVYTRKASTHGGEFAGSCPWCGGDDRFSIHPQINHFVCRQCKKAGDQISFVMEYLKKTYVETCNILNITPQYKFSFLDPAKESCGANEINWKPREIITPCDQWRVRAEQFAFYGHKFLMSPAGRIQRKWLNNRGLSNKTIKKARLGYNYTSVNFDLESWGLRPEKDFNGPTRSLWLPHGLIIPQFYNGKIIRLRIRQMDITAKSRFIIVKGSSTGFFDYDRHIEVSSIFAIHPWIVTESELDGWLLHQESHGSCRVFSIGNSSARPDKQTHEYLKNNPGLINLDNDEAGQNESTWWQKQYSNSIVYNSWRGKDPGEDYQQGVSISKWIQQGLSLLNISNNGDKKEQPGTSENFKKKIIDKYNSILNNNKEILKAFDDTNYGESLVKTVKKDLQKFEIKLCLHNDYCISLKGNICLIDKSKPFSTFLCPKRKWYAYQGGGVTEIILGEGFKKNF